jgi:predicted nuclease with TOPRIM domain
MSEQEDIKKTRIRLPEESEKIRAPEETRIYNATKELENDNTRFATRHTWIGDPDDRITRVAGAVSDDRETRVVSRSTVEDDAESLASKKIDAGAIMGRAKDITGSAARAGRLAVHDVKNVKVADKKKFSRFLWILGVLFVILILEIGYFKFASNVKKLPDEIKETQKELELTKKENALLEEEIEALGDYDSVEELKASWERLKDKVDKAAAGTYY